MEKVELNEFQTKNYKVNVAVGNLKDNFLVTVGTFVVTLIGAIFLGKIILFKNFSS